MSRFARPSNTLFSNDRRDIQVENKIIAGKIKKTELSSLTFHSTRLVNENHYVLGNVLKSSSRFVGSLHSSFSTGTSCLIQSGYIDKVRNAIIVVPLHVICDIDHLFKTGDVRKSYCDIESMRADFVGRSGDLFSFKINKVLKDGISQIVGLSSHLPSSNSFDFALLELNVSSDLMNRIVGPGFELDHVISFSNSFSKNTKLSFVVSRPFLKVDTIGRYSCSQGIDVANKNDLESMYNFETITKCTKNDILNGDKSLATLRYCTLSKTFKLSSLILGHDVKSGEEKAVMMKDVIIKSRTPKFSGDRISNFYLKNLHFDMITRLQDFHSTERGEENIEQILNFFGGMKKYFDHGRGLYRSIVDIPRFVNEVIIEKIVMTNPRKQKSYVKKKSSTTTTTKSYFFGFEDIFQPHFRAISIISDVILREVCKNGHNSIYREVVVVPIIKKSYNNYEEKEEKIQKISTKNTFFINFGFSLGFCSRKEDKTGWIRFDGWPNGEENFGFIMVPDSTPEQQLREGMILILDPHKFLEILLETKKKQQRSRDAEIQISMFDFCKKRTRRKR